jgi:acyl dehydratase
MPVDMSLMGRKGGRSRIVIERGPAVNFARAVKDDNPVFHHPAAAAEAGFDALPVPPTFTFVANVWGAYPELQPADTTPSPVGEVIAEYKRLGGLLLHGEQAFTYRRALQVGDVLDTESTVVDVYEKESGGVTMAFAVVETTYTDAETGEVVMTARSNFINRY